MKIGTLEHEEIIKAFEKQFLGRFDKEPKDFWKRGNVYQCGETNRDFLVFRTGVAFAKCFYRE